MRSEIKWLIMLLSLAGGAASATNRYVAANCPDPVSPFTNWANAATNIQDAIDIASAGDTVWVSNGVYDTGTKTATIRVAPETFRIALTKAITVRSANNDPANTMIAGQTAPDVKCVGMVSSSTLIGFTIYNGRSSTNGWYGSGVLGNVDQTAVVSNCIISACSNAYYGGGAQSVTLYNCLVTNNYALNGGAGLRYGTAYNSVFTGNSNQAMEGCIAYNCLVAGNSGNGGAGARYSTLYNCTVVSNTAISVAGGTFRSTNYNCISWDNNTADYQPLAYHSCGLGYTNGGSVYGNIDSNPQFKAAGAFNYRLTRESPCINAGSNQSWMADTSDLDGNPRIAAIFGTNVDMGAFEYFVRQGTLFRVH